MTRKEKFEQLLERIMLPENFERRNPTIFSDDDKKIFDFISDMKEYIELSEKVIATPFNEKKLDQRYTSLVKLLDKHGWK